MSGVDRSGYDPEVEVCPKRSIPLELIPGARFRGQKSSLTEVLTDEERTLQYLPCLIQSKTQKSRVPELVRESSNGVSQLVPFPGELRSIRLILRRIFEPLIELK